MKKILACALVLFSCAASATNLEFLTEEYPPYNMKQDGQLQGFAIELLEGVLKEMGRSETRSDVKLLPWARGYSLVQKSGKQNMLFSMTRTEEREDLFKWAGPITDTQIVVYAPKSAGIKINSDAELPQYTYGVVKGGVAGIILDTKGVDKKNLHEASSVTQSIKKVLSGRSQLLPYEKNVAIFEMKNAGINPDEFEVVYVLKDAQLFYAFNKSVDDAVIADFQAALDKVKTNSALMDELTGKYLK